MEILSDKIVTTRKEHDCLACFGKIPKGARMHRQVNVVDGIQVWKSCMTCYELTTVFREDFEDMDGTCYIGCVADELNGRTPEELLSELRKNQTNGTTTNGRPCLERA